MSDFAPESQIRSFGDMMPTGLREEASAPRSFGQMTTAPKSFITGQNLQGTGSGWDTPFFREWEAGYAEARAQGSEQDYFLNKRTGIAAVDQSGVDANGNAATVKAGDVYHQGKLVDNVYNRFGREGGDQILGRLLLKPSEVTHGVTVADKQAEVARQQSDAQGVRQFEQRVAAEKEKPEYDSWDTPTYRNVAVVGGAAGGAAAGAGAGAVIGAIFGGVGAIPGAAIGAAVGGIAGGVGGWLNRDELENQYARGEVQAKMLEEQGQSAAASSQRLQNFTRFATSSINPVTNLIHGGYDAATGTGGDDRSEFYATDEAGQLTRPAWLDAADFAGSFGDAALQFASPVGRALYTATMLSNVVSGVGTMTASGGLAFDDRQGSFDNVWLDEDGNLNYRSGAAASANLAIDAVQLAMGPAFGRLVQSARAGAAGAATAAGGRTITEGGYRITLNAAGEATGKRLALTALVPSETIAALNTRVKATMLARGAGREMLPQDFYRAALQTSGATTLRRAMLVNGFAEGYEEAVQAVLEAEQFQRPVDLEEVARSAAKGALMGAGMSAGARVGGLLRDPQGRIVDTMSGEFKDYSRYASLAWIGGKEPLAFSEWKTRPLEERARMSATDPAAAAALRQAAETTAEELTGSLPAGAAGNEYIQLSVLRAQENEAKRLNTFAEGTYLISGQVGEVDDKTVQASISTVRRLFEQSREGLRDQVNDTQDEALRASLQVTLTRTEELVKQLRQAEELFYADTATEAFKRALVQQTNDMLRKLFEIDPSKPETIDIARSVSLPFWRNPGDGPGSLQALLPQVNYLSSVVRADNGLQIGYAPLKPMSGDFDGDKITLKARTVLSPDVFLSLRTGLNDVGTLETGVNLMTRGFEESKIRQMADSLRQSRNPQTHPVYQMTQGLKGRLNRLLSLNGKPIAPELVQKLVDDIRVGDTDAKESFLNDLAFTYPAELTEWAKVAWQNPWFEVNTAIERTLREFQIAQSSTIQDAVEHDVYPVNPSTDRGEVFATRAANLAHALVWEVPGSSMFRSLGALHYTLYGSNTSTDLDRRMEHTPAAFQAYQQLVARYEEINRRAMASDYEDLVNKDAVVRRAWGNMLKFAANSENEISGSPQRVVLLANLEMPSYDQHGNYQENLTVAQFMLRQAARQEMMAMQSAGTWDLEPQLKMKYLSMMRMSPGEALAEIAGDQQLVDLIGQDAEAFGGNLTMRQFLARQVNQSSFSQREVGRYLRLHASYLAKSKESGRHNLPYLMSDLTRETNPITPYQSVADAVMEAMNAWPVTQRNKSNRIEETFTKGVESLQQYARQQKIDPTSVDGWLRLFSVNEAARLELFKLVEMDLVGEVFTSVSPTESTVAPWVYKMLTRPPAEAAMIYLKHTLLARLRMTEEHAERNDTFSPDRLVVLIHRLRSDRRGSVLLDAFTEQLNTAKTTKDFFDWINLNLRGEEAEYLPWVRDTAMVDPSLTQGGWSTSLPSSTLMELVQEFSERAERFVTGAAMEQAAIDNDAEVIAQLVKLAKDPNGDNSLLAKQLTKLLEFSQEFITPLAPNAMARAGIAGLRGMTGSATDKGTPPADFAHLAMHDAAQDPVFGAAEEIAEGWLTAHSVKNAANATDSMMAGPMRLVDEMGVAVDWAGLDWRTFAKLIGQKAPGTQIYPNRNRLVEMLTPAVNALNNQGNIEKRSITEPSLASLLLTGASMHDTLYGNNSNSIQLYGAMIEGVVGKPAFQQLVNMISHSRMSTAKRRIQSPAELEARYWEAYSDAVKVLRAVGQVAQQEFPIKARQQTILPLDYAFQKLKYRLEHGRPEQSLTEDEKAFRGLVSSILTRQLVKMKPNPNSAKFKALVSLRDQFDGRTRLLSEYDRIIKAYALPAKKKSKKDSRSDESTDHWMVRTLARRIQLVDRVRARGDLLSQGREYHVALEKVINFLPSQTQADKLPELSVSEWIDVSKAVVTHEIVEMATFSIPGHENAPVGDPSNRDWLRLHQPSWLNLIDFLDEDNELVKAAVKLDQVFMHSNGNQILPDDFVALVENTILDQRKLGKWDDTIAQHIMLTNGWGAASGNKLGVSAAGIAPEAQKYVNAAQQRTYRVPDATELPAMLSTTTVSYEDLLPETSRKVNRPDRMVTVTRPGGTQVEMPQVALDNRFAAEVWVTTASGQRVDLLVNGKPKPGISTPTVDETTTSLRSIMRTRLINAYDSIPKHDQLPLDQVTFEIKFLHPADQPSGPEWANNIFFEGSALSGFNDLYGSLNAAWYMAPGGILQTGSRLALDAQKTMTKAIKKVEKELAASRIADEAGWETDLYSVLERKARRMMQLDLGDGRRVAPEFYNSVLKSLKEKMFIRGLDSSGEVQVISGRDAIAMQQVALKASAPVDFGLTKLQLYVTPRETLRTLYGDVEGQGEIRVPMDPIARPTGMQIFDGVFTEAHRARVPGMFQLEKKDFFETSGRNRRPMSRYYGGNGFTEEQNASMTKRMELVRTEATEINTARAQSPTSNVFSDRMRQVRKELKNDLVSMNALDDVRIATNLSTDPKMSKLHDKYLVNSIADSLSSNPHQVIWKYDIRPAGPETRQFGVLHGPSALYDNRKQQKSNWISSTDPIWMPIDGLTLADWRPIRDAINWATANESMVILTSTSYSELQIQAEELLREQGYERVPGSRVMWQRPETGPKPLLQQQRIQAMTQSRHIPLSRLTLAWHTDMLDENTAVITEDAEKRRYRTVSNLIPTNAWTGFGQPLPEHMPYIHAQLAPANWDGIIANAKIAKGSDLTQQEREDLEAALKAAYDIAADPSLQGWPAQMTGELRPGAILPMYDTESKQIILTRYGYEPAAHTFTAQFATGRGLAIYAAEPFQPATTNSGTVVRYLDAGQFGKRVELMAPLQQWFNKLQVYGSGFKGLTVVQQRNSQRMQSVKMPRGFNHVPFEVGLGLKDEIKKNNFVGTIYTFNSAITYLGMDFRPIYAKAFGIKNPTESDLKAVELLISYLAKQPKFLTADQVLDQMRAPEVDPLLIDRLSTLDLPKPFTTKKLQQVLELTNLKPEIRLTRQMLLYMQYDGARAEDVLSFSGVDVPQYGERGYYLVEAKKLFTDVLDRAAIDDPIRKYMRDLINERLPNPDASVDGSGIRMKDDFSFEIITANKKERFTAMLQFAQIDESGDNPSINIEAQDRASRQADASQPRAVQYSALGAEVATSKQLTKTPRLIERLRADKSMTGAEVTSLIQTLPDQTGMASSYWYNDLPLMLPGEKEYVSQNEEKIYAIRSEIDRTTEAWTRDKRISEKAMNERAQLAARLNISGYEEVIDYWTRMMYFAPTEQGAEDANIGQISPEKASEAYIRMTRLVQEGRFPWADGVIFLAAPQDVQLLHRAAASGRSQLNLVSHKGPVTELRDWYLVALGDAQVPVGEKYDDAAKDTVDAFFHLYHNLPGMGFNGMAMSLYEDRADALLDPETRRLMISIDPQRAAALAAAPMVSGRLTLAEILAMKDNMLDREQASKSSFQEKTTAKLNAWHQQNNRPRPLTSDPRDLLSRGTQYVTRTTTENGLLRTLSFWRDAITLNNPVLWGGAIFEQVLESMRTDTAAFIAGETQLGGGSGITPETWSQLHRLWEALGNNQEFKSLVSEGFSMDAEPYAAGRAEMIAMKAAKFGGKMQDATYKMRANAVAKRYVMSAIAYQTSRGANPELAAKAMIYNLGRDAGWLPKNDTEAHVAATNHLLQQKNMKENTLAKFINDAISAGVKSKSKAISSFTTLAIHIPFKYRTYAINKAVQVLGLDAVDQAWALLLHGRKYGPNSIIARMQKAVSGEPYTEADGYIDMSSVIESLDITSAFIKGGLTHSGLFALGMLAGGLGLSGEDEEDRRLRRIAQAKGIPHYLDPTDLANDFRNADAIYLDAIPILGPMFSVPNADGKGGSRSIANMNWIMKQFFSPIIGMERFFNTGNPMELWWGVWDALGSMPLINTQLIADMQEVFQETSEAALQAEAIGTPEAMDRSFGLWLRLMMSMERMLMESSFANMLYIAADPWDRDPYTRPDYTVEGTIKRNQLGLPDRSTALQKTINPATGNQQDSYLTRDAMDASVRGYAENRMTLALLGTLYGKIASQDSMMRGDMVVKERVIKKEGLTVDEAHALIKSIYKQAAPADPQQLAQVYIPLEVRNVVKQRMMDELYDEGMIYFKDEKKATAWMWDHLQGKGGDKRILSLENLIYSKGDFEGLFSYKPSDKYYQQNTTYVIGPDGKPWATGIARNDVFNLGGMAPLQRYLVVDPGNRSRGSDGTLNTVDKVRGINTGMRGLVPISDGFAIPDVDEKIADAINKALAQQKASTTNASGWQDYPQRAWTNYARRSGGGGGGGGSGGSGARLQAPERQQVPYANDAQTINTSNPIIRRAQIRRERIGSERGRLKSWE